MRAAIAAGLAVLVLAGCGGGERETVPASRLAAAAEATRDAPSERVHVAIAVNAFATDVHVAGDGVFDNRRGDGRMTLDMSDAAGLAGAPGAERADVIARGDAVWIRWAPFAQRLGADRPWVRFDAEPLALVTHGLRGLKGDAEVVGQETVRGTPTTRYTTKVDPRRYGNLPVGGDEVPVDVWVAGASGRVSRVRVKAPVSIPNGPGFDLDVTVELYDFGAPVGHVVPPPASAAVRR